MGRLAGWYSLHAGWRVHGQQPSCWLHAFLTPELFACTSTADIRGSWMAFLLSCTSRFLAYIWWAESIIIPCLFMHSTIPKNIETSTQKHRFIQCNLIIKHKVSVHLRMNVLLQLFSSTPCNWTSYIKCNFIWRWVNARNVLITRTIALIAPVLYVL